MLNPVIPTRSKFISNARPPTQIHSIKPLTDKYVKGESSLTNWDKQFINQP